MRLPSFLRLFLPALVVFSLPAVAGFTPQQQVQVVRLAYGQTEARVVFHTSDGSHVVYAQPDCDCTSLRPEATRLVAQVDTSGFDQSVDKKISVLMSDGQRTTLTMRFEVPQAVIISSPSLIWERGAAPAPQEFRLRIPQGSPVRALLAADISGDDFDYEARTLRPGHEYLITVSPRSTARRRMNRLIIRMDADSPRYQSRVLYLRVR